MGTQIVLVRKKHWDDALTLARLLKGKNAISDRIIAESLGLKPDQSHILWFGVDCPTCKARPETYCVTINGKKASSRHRPRFIAGLACIFAMEDELTIVEEAEITD